MSDVASSGALPKRSMWDLKILYPVIISILIALAVFQSYEQTPALPKSVIVGSHIGTCIENFRKMIVIDQSSIEQLYRINGLCYDSIMSQVTVEEQTVRRDTLIFQRAENIILLAMVVLVTLSGVALAAVQLMTSYKLAMSDKVGELKSNEGSVGFENGGLIVKSSVVGVLILAISFAFFAVFVTSVYTIHEQKSGETSDILQSNLNAKASTNFTLLSEKPAANVPNRSEVRVK